MIFVLEEAETISSQEYNIIYLVSDKCPGFCKCLRLSNYGFATFSKNFWPPKVTSTLIKKTAEHDVDDDNNKVYLNITSGFYPLVHVIIRLYGS